MATYIPILKSESKNTDTKTTKCICFLLTTAISLLIGNVYVVIECTFRTKVDTQTPTNYGNTIFLPCDKTDIQSGLCPRESTLSNELFFQLGVGDWETLRVNDTTALKEGTMSNFHKLRSLCGPQYLAVVQIYIRFKNTHLKLVDRLAWLEDSRNPSCHHISGLQISYDGLVLMHNVIQIKYDHELPRKVETYRLAIDSKFMVKTILPPRIKKDVFRNTYYFIGLRVRRNETVKTTISDPSIVYSMGKSSTIGFYGFHE